jgi:hypothetical protein
MNNLTAFLTRFIELNEKNLQLDFFCRKQVILQIFKMDDVKNWGKNIEQYVQGDLVIELTFNKHKIDNSNNKQRFINSDLKDTFKKIDDIQQDSYWLGLNSSSGINQIQKEMLSIIHNVYKIDNEPVEFTLNTY